MSRRSHLLPEDAAPEVSGALDVPVRPETGWRCVILTEIANFAALRRDLGNDGAHTLVDRIATRLEDAAPLGVVTIVGRNLVEVIAEVGSSAEYDALLTALYAVGGQSLDIAGRKCEPSLIFGTAIASQTDLDMVTIVERAEAALERSRRNVLRSPAAEVSGASLMMELDRAIENDELVMFYQPKFHVRRQQVTCAEALIRWRHPERGMIPPGDFIAAAEEADLIDRLTLWTIRRVIADQARFREAGHDLRLFVNLSGQLLADTAFIEQACEMITGSDATLGFEVTETSVIRDPVSAIANLQKFADIGIRIAIDDYGAGLSSLAYLKQLPASELKIDKLFVTQLTSSNRDPLIVRSTIDLAHALEMEVVAEGVESHAALALLTVMGCDMVQGFLISRPVAGEALIEFLDDESRQQAAAHDARNPLNRLASVWKRG